MKVTIDITYHKLDDNHLEYLEMNYIVHSHEYGWKESIRINIQDQWEEMLLSLVEDKGREYDVVYNTVFEVDINYSKDYYGEVDVDWEAAIIDHGGVGMLEDGGILFAEHGAKTEEWFTLK